MEEPGVKKRNKTLESAGIRLLAIGIIAFVGSVMFAATPVFLFGCIVGSIYIALAGVYIMVAANRPEELRGKFLKSGVGLTYIFLGLVLIASAFLLATVPVIIWGLAVGGICAALAGVGMLVIGTLKNVRLRQALSRILGVIYMAIGAILFGIALNFTFPAAVLLFVLASIGFLVTAVVSVAVGGGFSTPTLRKHQKIDSVYTGKSSSFMSEAKQDYDIDTLDTEVKALTMGKFLKGVEATMQNNSPVKCDVSSLDTEGSVINKLEKNNESNGYKVGEYAFKASHLMFDSKKLNRFIEGGQRLYCMVFSGGDHREAFCLVRNHMKSCCEKEGLENDYSISLGDDSDFIFCKPALMVVMLNAHKENLPSALLQEQIVDPVPSAPPEEDENNENNHSYQ